MRRLDWTPSFFGFEQPTVWIDIDRADVSWSATPLYIPRGGPGDWDKYERIGEWITGYDGPIEMPSVSLPDGHLTFADGRHRFAWLRDHGVTALPVTISHGWVRQLESLAGTQERASILVQTST